MLFRDQAYSLRSLIGLRVGQFGPQPPSPCRWPLRRCTLRMIFGVKPISFHWSSGRMTARAAGTSSATFSSRRTDCPKRDRRMGVSWSWPVCTSIDPRGSRSSFAGYIQCVCNLQLQLLQRLQGIGFSGKRLDKRLRKLVRRHLPPAGVPYSTGPRTKLFWRIESSCRLAEALRRRSFSSVSVTAFAVASRTRGQDIRWRCIIAARR